MHIDEFNIVEAFICPSGDGRFLFVVMTPTMYDAAQSRLGYIHGDGQVLNHPYYFISHIEALEGLDLFAEGTWECDYDGETGKAWLHRIRPQVADRFKQVMEDLRFGH